MGATTPENKKRKNISSRQLAFFFLFFCQLHMRTKYIYIFFIIQQRSQGPSRPAIPIAGRDRDRKAHRAQRSPSRPAIPIAPSDPHRWARSSLSQGGVCFTPMTASLVSTFPQLLHRKAIGPAITPKTHHPRMTFDERTEVKGGQFPYCLCVGPKRHVVVRPHMNEFSIRHLAAVGALVENGHRYGTTARQAESSEQEDLAFCFDQCSVTTQKRTYHKQNKKQSARSWANARVG